MPGTVIGSSHARRIRQMVSFLRQAWKMNPKGEKTWGALKFQSGRHRQPTSRGFSIAKVIGGEDLKI